MLLSSLNKRYASKNGLDIIEKPDQYFNSYSLVAGTITYKGITYNIKKIQLEDNIKPNSFPEVQLIDLNPKSPYILKYIDYIIEQEEHDGHWEDKAVYILMENSDYDLRTYVTKNGPLGLEDTLALCECLIGANYYFQKQLKKPHGDIRPQNVRVILQKNSRPTFKLSYFEDKYIPQAHQLCMLKDTLAYMAPELLNSSAVKGKYGLQESPVKPSQELQTLISECPNEIRYEPFRGDVFSAGMVIFSAATNMFFRLPLLESNDAPRDGAKEMFVVAQALKALKNQHQCDGLVELLRIMMTHNPFLRYDFEELALRMTKLNARDPRIPKIRQEESNRELEDEHRILKGKFLELQGLAVKMREREMEFQNIINQLREQLDNQCDANQIETRKTLEFEEQPIEILNEISSIASILDEHMSFLSPSHKKALGSVDSRDKKFDFSETKASSKNLESQVLKEPPVLGLKKRTMSTNEANDQQKAANRHKNANTKMNQGQLTHLEIKHSIIKRREISDLRIPS